MIKTSDFIHHNGSIPDFDYEMLNSNCKVVAIFKDTGDGFKKFDEYSCDNYWEVYRKIVDVLFWLKIMFYEMTNPMRKCYAELKVLDFQESFGENKIRLVIYGVECDFIGLETCFNQAI